MNEDKNTFGVVICIILLLFAMLVSNSANSNSIGNSRQEQRMVYIQEGFAYDMDTKIIYREYISGRSKYSYDKTSYAPYISKDGNYFKYVNGEWIEVED